MSTASQNRVIAVLKLPLSVPQLIKMAQAIIAALTGNAHIPSPNPSVATLTGAVDKLVVDEAATKTRAAGTVATRNVSRTSLVSLLHATKANVQQQADLNPEQASAIIASAAMGVRKATTRTKAPFVAKPGLVSGTVKLVVKAAAVRASYDWEWSGDAGVSHGTTAHRGFRASRPRPRPRSRAPSQLQVQYCRNCCAVAGSVAHAPFSSNGLSCSCWLTKHPHCPPAWQPSCTVLPAESVAVQPHSLRSVAHAGLPHEPRGPVAGGTPAS